MISFEQLPRGARSFAGAGRCITHGLSSAVRSSTVITISAIRRSLKSSSLLNKKLQDGRIKKRIIIGTASVYYNSARIVPGDSTMQIRQCKTYKGYGASEDGSIWSFKKPTGDGVWKISKTPIRKLSPFLESPGSARGRSQPRLCLFIRFRGLRKKLFVHQLVCDAWHRRSKPTDVVIHLNDVAQDCRPSNLRYASLEVNCKYRRRNQLKDITIASLEKKIKILERKLAKHV